MSHPMMKCGHAANSEHNGQPSCAICFGIDPGATVVADEPEMAERLAKCYCGRTQPSSKRESLAFFEFRGEGSRQALTSCKNCGYHEVAHKDDKPHLHGRVCDHFTPHGAYEFDLYYCGCRGWD